MIDTSQREFKAEFGVDERVEIINKDSRICGSKGYVNSIVIERNGIMYSVIITERNNYKLNDGQVVRDLFRPTEIKMMAHMLKSIR